MSDQIRRVFLIYIFRSLCISFILVNTFSVYHFATFKGYGESLVFIFIATYATLFFAVAIFFLENRSLNRLVSLSTKGLKFFEELWLIIILNRYHFTIYITFALITSSVFTLMTKSINSTDHLIYVILFAVIAGYTCRRVVSDLINKMHISDNLIKDIALLMCPVILLFIMFFVLSILTRGMILGFASGVLLDALVAYYKNRIFLRNKNGHIAVWNNQPEAFMKKSNNKLIDTPLSKTMKLIMKGNRFSAWRAIRYLNRSNEKGDLCRDNECCDASKEYFVNICRANLILKKFDKIVDIYNTAVSKGHIDDRLTYVASQALSFLKRNNDAINLVLKHIEEKGGNRQEKSLKYLYVRLAEAYAIQSFDEKKIGTMDEESLNYLKKAMEVDNDNDNDCIISKTYNGYYLAIQDALQQILYGKAATNRNEILQTIESLTSIQLGKIEKKSTVDLQTYQTFILVLSGISTRQTEESTLSKFKMDRSFSSSVFMNIGLNMEKNGEIRNALFNYVRAVFLEDSSLDPLAPALARNRFNAIVSAKDT